MNNMGRITRVLLISLFTIAVLSGFALAIPPTPEAKQKWIEQGLWNQKVENWKAFKAAGGCAPVSPRVFNSSKLKQNQALGIQSADTVHVIVILVDFSDQPWQTQSAAVTPTMFDSILFSNRSTDAVHMPTGSMTDFYLENSYGQFYIVGKIFGWFRASQTLAYYEGGNDGLGPRAQQLVTESVLKADSAGADYSEFDHDHNGQCDGVVVIHSGPGAETGAFGIWSHAWTIGPLTLDGVTVSNYTINPEELTPGPSTIGVFCHEYGHFLGLPDLYDIDYTPAGSDGTGDWSLMSGGSWNGGGAVPSSFDGWSKCDIGFVNFVDLSANMNHVAFPAVEYNPVIYRLGNSISKPNEYWYVENRQKTGFDATLPGSGLLVYHVDFGVQGSNVDNTRWFVGVEQADGNFDLEWTVGDAGDQGDPFPGSSNARSFNDLTVPNSATNVGAVATHIGLWDISDNDSVIYADLDIAWSRPYLTLTGADSVLFDDPLPLGDNDGDLDPGETVNFYCTIKNQMLTGYNPHLHLSTGNPDVSFLANDVAMNSNLTTSPVSNTLHPIQLLIDDSAKTVIDTFVIAVTSDSLASTPGSGEFVTTFTFTYAVGSPKILVVDDDRGASEDTAVTRVFQTFSKPYKVWNKNSQGSPSGSDLSNYPMVFWNTGDSAGNVLNTADIASMKSFLNNGGRLFLSTTSGIQTMSNLDSAFLRDYFKARYVGQSSVFNIRGVTGSLLGNDSKYRAPFIAPFDNVHQTMSVASSGEAFLSYSSGSPTPTCGISSNGTYKTVLMSFPLESIQDNAGGDWWPKDTLINRILFWLFDSPDSTNPRTIQSFTVLNQSQYNLTNHTPAFGWTVQLGYPGDFQSKYQIQIGTDNDWSVAELWNPGEISSADTFAVYSGSTLIDGATYYARVRVQNGIAWSDWYQMTFRMNTPPNPPVPRRPISDAVTPAKPRLFVTNAIDPNGDSPLTYIFEICTDSGLTTLVAADSFVAQSADSTGWTSDVSLSYSVRYWWRAKANDGFELSAYSSTASFIVQSSPQAPSIPTALTPIDTGGWPVFTMLPTFDWSDATDPNPFDTVTYRLKIGLDSNFISVININSIPTSQYTLTSPLVYNHKYFWRVTAHDNTGLASAASNVVSFWTWTLGDVNHSHSTDIVDLTFMVDRFFRGGPAIVPSKVGDLNGDCALNILDLTYMVDRLFRGGPVPVPGC